MAKVTTGIKGLDELLQGGYPERSTILVSGTPGSGKTIFGLQFLVEGARKGEKGIYITFEETVDEIKQQGLQFGWDLKAMQEKNLLRVLNIKAMNVRIDRVLEEIEKLVKGFGAQRVVFDSLTTLITCAELLEGIEISRDFKNMENITMPVVFGDAVIRKSILSLIERMRVWDITILLTSELPDNSPYLSRDTVSEFLVDGVVKLKKAMGKRLLMIEKMRSTKHPLVEFSFSIEQTGVMISEGEVRKW